MKSSMVIAIQSMVLHIANLEASLAHDAFFSWASIGKGRILILGTGRLALLGLFLYYFRFTYVAYSHPSL